MSRKRLSPARCQWLTQICSRDGFFRVIRRSLVQSGPGLVYFSPNFTALPTIVTPAADAFIDLTVAITHLHSCR